MKHVHVLYKRSRHAGMLKCSRPACAACNAICHSTSEGLRYVRHVWRQRHLIFTTSGMWAAPWGMSLLATTRIGWEQADPNMSFPVWLYTPTTRRKLFDPTWLPASSIAQYMYLYTALLNSAAQCQTEQTCCTSTVTCSASS